MNWHRSKPIGPIWIFKKFWNTRCPFENVKIKPTSSEISARFKSGFRHFGLSQAVSQFFVHQILEWMQMNFRAALTSWIQSQWLHGLIRNEENMNLPVSVICAGLPFLSIPNAWTRTTAYGRLSSVELCLDPRQGVVALLNWFDSIQHIIYCSMKHQSVGCVH